MSFWHTFFTPSNTEKLKLIRSQNTHPSATEMQFCSPDAKQGEY
ncbi:hypothetical protein EYF80_059741 [Liparis tanakae]|uniref:Uncharacterized protein n=1 Tax=Liparis tanakae TaxID=230148 RepID=A0A4Z2EMD2_9TELE|nr:hypothetical protein EYF80_059741 [Liparis tanakae]